MKALVLLIIVLSIPRVAAAESWILWESVEEHRLHPVDSPFPSQATCVSRAQARIAQYRQQERFRKPGVVSDVTDGGLTFSIRWKVTNHTARAKDIAAAMTEYRKSLGKLLAVYEGSLAKAVERREQRRALYDRGVIGQSAIDDAETEVTTTQQKVDSTRREMAEVDRKLAEPIPPPTTRWVGFTALRYQCWPVGVNP